MPQLNTYVKQRLADWAVWLYWGNSGKPQRVVSWYEKVVMAPNVQGRGADNAVCPVSEIDAYETHKAISALAPYLRDTIIEYWTKAGTADHKARELGISRDQLYARLQTAENKLLGYLNDLSAGIPLPPPETDPKRAKKRHGKKSLHLPDSFRTFHATMA